MSDKTAQWVEPWLNRHSDTWHPASRRDCEQCQEMIRIYGPMPPAHLIEAYHQPRLRPAAIKASIPDTLRWQVWERDNFTCRHCGSRRRLSVDHIIPETHGGTLHIDNLQTLCRSCNSRKGARTG